MSLAARLAARAPAPVFMLVGDGGRVHARRLRADGRLRFKDSPRHASVLLVLGEIPQALHESARQIHDQVSPPRATVALDPGGATPLFDEAEVLRDPAAVGDVVVHVHRALVSGRRRSEPDLGPADNPVAWKGRGPHGQGGEGMMGGTPYGRSMAMTGTDLRDGLQLDCFQAPVGPFLGWLPPGLGFDLVLQGDVVQEARLHVAPFTRRDVPAIFDRALEDEVEIRDLELERARHHLHATADLLRLHGLDAHARRVAQLACRLQPRDAGRVRTLGRWLRWTGALRIATRGVGVLDTGTVDPALGPVARAAGLRQDARTDDPAYADLGFAPVVHGAGDAEARWRQRLAEAAQSLALAQRAGDRRRAPGAPLEGPRGLLEETRGASWRTLLEHVTTGQAYDEFATTVVSLDLDPAAMPPPPEVDDDGHQ